MTEVFREDRLSHMSDIIDLRDFYNSPLGGVARRVIRQKLRTFWPDCAGLKVLGLGYCTPYLGLWRETSERTLAFMPSTQGVLHWPNGGRSLTALVDDRDLPLANASIDRLLIVHTLENTENLRHMLREAWRILEGSGKVIIVVPNRSGIWARIDRTPFGAGRPYSVGQLKRLLRDSLFTPLRTDHALYMPPFENRMMVRSAMAWEQVGSFAFQRLAGVSIIEATKQIYALKPNAPERARRRGFVAIPQRQETLPRQSSQRSSQHSSPHSSLAD